MLILSKKNCGLLSLFAQTDLAPARNEECRMMKAPHAYANGAILEGF
jgi:hypothetical protein